MNRSPNIVRAIKYRRLRLEMGRSCSQNGKRYEYFQKQERDFYEGLGMDGEGNMRMDLKEIDINTRN